MKTICAANSDIFLRKAYELTWITCYWNIPNFFHVISSLLVRMFVSVSGTEIVSSLHCMWFEWNDRRIKENTWIINVWYLWSRSKYLVKRQESIINPNHKISSAHFHFLGTIFRRKLIWIQIKEHMHKQDILVIAIGMKK
jgi:hypothetical protein